MNILSSSRMCIQTKCELFLLTFGDRYTSVSARGGQLTTHSYVIKLIRTVCFIDETCYNFLMLLHGKTCR